MSMDVTSALARPSAPTRSAAPARLVLLSVGALRHVLVISAASVAALSVWVLVGLDGRDYYSTPIAVRGYHTAHAALRPSGLAGQTFGLVGLLLMFVPFFYMLAKRVPRLRVGANLKMWLEIHIFCGIVGPVLVTYHTAFKFNGLVSVAYWSMVLVALSGFVGRYLYMRIPRTIRGVEVSEAEIAAKLDEFREHLQWVTPPAVMDSMEEFERGVLANTRSTSVMGRLTGGSWGRRGRLARYRDELVANAVSPDTAREVADLLGERALLTAKVEQLRRTKRLFDAWHVFHLPLVYVMLAIVTMHVALVLYLGYVPFQW